MSHRSWNALFLSPVSVCLLPQLLKDISQRQRDSRQQKQVDLRRAYITARFTPATLPAFFTLGDQLDYGGFENRALDSGQEYVFFILAELNSTTGVRTLPPPCHVVTIPWLPCSLCSPLPPQAVTLHCDQYYLAAKTMNSVSVKVL